MSKLILINTNDFTQGLQRGQEKNVSKPYEKLLDNTE